MCRLSAVRISNENHVLGTCTNHQIMSARGIPLPECQLPHKIPRSSNQRRASQATPTQASIGLTKNIETGKASWNRGEISSNASKRSGTWNKSTVMKKQESTCLCNFYAQRPGESNETNKSQTTVKDLRHALVLQLAQNAPARTSGAHVYSSF